jgi:hypothetical protein
MRLTIFAGRRAQEALAMIFKAQFLGLDFQVCLGQSVDEEAIGVIPSK